MIIDIIGAGIGGLTTAIALRQQGLEVRLWERAADLQPVGAGIMLAANAMQVYRDLSLLPPLLERGVALEHANITDEHLQPLAMTDWAELEVQFGVPTLAIHRSALQEVLLAQLPEGILHLDHALESVVPAGKQAVLTFANGHRLTADCVLGADGIHSKVRQALFPNSALRQAQQYCWRGLATATLPEARRHTLTEAWGKGLRVGFVPVDETHVYWFAVESVPTGQTPTAVADLPEQFGTFDPLVVSLLAQTPPSCIHAAPLADLEPLPQWHQGCVGLLGDAAHAPTPNMGQGAGQAIEDARVLAACLAHYGAPSTAFARFETLRRPKVEQIVRNSWRIGQVAHWQHPLARKVRKWILRTTPKRLQQQQLEQLATLVKVP